MVHNYKKIGVWAELHSYNSQLRRMARHIQPYLTFMFMMFLLMLLVAGSFYMAELEQLCFIYGGLGLHTKNAHIYLKFMFMMFFLILMVVRKWIILYTRIPATSVSPRKMTSPWIYDVFLSFRGPDVRRGFVDHLYNALTSAGIHVFLDTHELNKGEDISTSIKHAIESSRIWIPIFSPDYANSVWCLNEILLIARQKHGIAVPLFYKIDPSHVRHPERSGSPFYPAFQHYQSRQEIDEWKAALFTVCSLAGWSLEDTNGYEAALVKRVVQDVRKRCKRWGRWGLIGRLAWDSYRLNYGALRFINWGR